MFNYLFDYGDEWWHEITVDQVDASPEKGKYTRVVETRGKSPPQYPDLEDDQDDGRTTRSLRSVATTKQRFQDSTSSVRKIDSSFSVNAARPGARSRSRSIP